MKLCVIGAEFGDPDARGIGSGRPGRLRSKNCLTWHCRFWRLGFTGGTANPLGRAALTLCGAAIAVRCGIWIWHRLWELGGWDLLIRKMAISQCDAIA